MAREQPNMGDLLPLLESSDLHELDEIKALVNEHLSSDRGSLLLNGLVDYYLETSSPQALHILSSVREPHDKHLFDKMNECMAKPACRLATLTLLGHVIRKQPPWIHKISRTPLLLSLLKCLKTDTDVVVLITGVLVLIILLPMIPQAGKQLLYEFFDIFGRLAAWNLKNPGYVTEVYLIHLHASVYSLFHRLYGMYPCNFVSYLRSHYCMKENMETFEEVVKPMLEHVRIHPELVTGTKDHELDPTRWKRFEIHDIVIECAKVSLDPKEASCEEGYSTIPEHFSTHLQHRPADCTASPYADLHSSYGSTSSTPFSTPRQALPPLSGTQPPSRLPDPTQDVIWSPATMCGMSTPPSSRGISPTNAPAELSLSASHFPGRVHSTPAPGKGTPSTTPATASPPPTATDEFVQVALPPCTTSPPRKDGKPESSKPGLVRQEPVREAEKGGADAAPGRGAASENMTVSLTELPMFIKELEQQQHRMEKEPEEDAITEELLLITEDQRQSPGLRGGFDSPFYHTTETLTGNQKKALPMSALVPAPGCTPNSESHRAVSTPDKAVPLAVVEGQEAPCFFQPVFTPIEHPVARHFARSPSAPAPGGSTHAGPCGLFSPSPCKSQAPPYEALFDLALPKAAALFVGRRTSEALHRSVGERPDEEEGEGVVSTSPLEVLDRLIQQGSDAHDKVLKRLPLPSKSADWTHFGGKHQSIKAKGSAPLDELHTLRSQLLLLHSQLLFERYKREQHALRNRRLLRRIINATALEEQNAAMKNQLNLQEVDIQSLKESLQVEQQRYQQLWDDREMVVTRLHSQIRQLQQGRDEYYTKNQELQSKLQECQKKMGEMEAELQKANNKVCNTGHLLNQLSVKLTNSEAVQQQMEFLNKQLLLLGEVNRLAMEELLHSSPDTSKEVDMLRASYGKELEKLRQSLVQQSQRLEAAQHRIGELESQLAKKEHLIVEQKKFLEDVKSQARGELQGSQSRYQAQRQVTQVLQTELLQLYSRLEMELPCEGAGADMEPCSPLGSRGSGSESTVPGNVAAHDGPGSGPADSPKGNGSTLSSGKPPAPPGSRGSVNGSRDPPLLLEPSPSHCPPAPSDAPLTVGSYPSAKSFLGMRNNMLFRNKSESQCDDEPPRLAGLSQTLKTEQCVEPMAEGAAAVGPTWGPAAKEGQPDAQQRANNRQQLRIMDYNETHQEHS
ncbi:hamartin isoform X2 [Amia ocellicauda]|uniref:hamartin isoform X2 n=1 Tax=Amia ocellicauda TaxID=2972642 RepID=UPI003463B660